MAHPELDGNQTHKVLVQLDEDVPHSLLEHELLHRTHLYREAEWQMEESFDNAHTNPLAIDLSTAARLEEGLEIILGWSV